MKCDAEEDEILREGCDHGSGYLALHSADSDGFHISLSQADGENEGYGSIIVSEPDTARRIARHLVAWADKHEEVSS